MEMVIILELFVDGCPLPSLHRVRRVHRTSIDEWSIATSDTPIEFGEESLNALPQPPIDWWNQRRPERLGTIIGRRAQRWVERQVDSVSEPYQLWLRGAYLRRSSGLLPGLK